MKPRKDRAQTEGQRMVVCVVCGAQFLRKSSHHGATCSAACLGWLRLKNKGREEEEDRSRADPADGYGAS